MIKENEGDVFVPKIKFIKKARRFFWMGVFGCFISSRVFCTGLEEKYCVAVLPCPVLNSPEFRSVFGGTDGKTLKEDEKGLIREVEFVALPGTAFEIISIIQKPDHSIMEVRTGSYPSQAPLYIDSRFVSLAAERPQDRAEVLFPADQILSALQAMEGSPYLWGGNFADGIDQMLVFYPPSGEVPLEKRSRWRLEGVDCSGLIYQASGGYTPRNTSAMVYFGEGVNISGLSARAIAERLAPLDLIVWPGHVVIVMDSETAIESSHLKGGVVKSDLVTRLESVMEQRTAMDEWDPENEQGFVVRRWHPAIGSSQPGSGR